jgi:hypothetical protein
MPAGSGLMWGERLRPWGFLALLCLFFATLGWYGLPAKSVSVDFICYFSAAKLLATGRSPYDLGNQIETQQALGWDKAKNGYGELDCLPYFYPPWFALACAAFLPLGYTAGKAAFFALNIALALSAGYLLRGTARGAPGCAPPLVAPLFVFSVACVLLGQTSLLVLLLAVLARSLLDKGHDRVAGVVLAWLTIKPQLTALLLLAVLLRALRERRWRVLVAFLVTLGLLVVICTAIVPTWPLQMLDAPRQSPPPTEQRPWIGNTWFLLLRTIHLEGGPLWLLYLALAVPFTVAVVRAALDRARPLSEIVAQGLLAAFFVAPYARHYDFPVLLAPAVLVAGRLPRVAGVALLLALVLLPYAQYAALAQMKAATDPDGKFLVECTFFWVPLLLAAMWLVPRRPPIESLALKAA